VTGEPTQGEQQGEYFTADLTGIGNMHEISVLYFIYNVSVI